MQESAERLESMIAKAKGKCEKEEDDPDDPADPEDPEEEDDSGNPQPAGGSTGKKNGTTKTKKSKEGGYTDMKFNETNMTAADRLAFEELKKRYGFIYVDRNNDGEGTMARSKKESFDYFKALIESNGEINH